MMTMTGRSNSKARLKVCLTRWDASAYGQWAGAKSMSPPPPKSVRTPPRPLSASSLRSKASNARTARLTPSRSRSNPWAAPAETSSNLRARWKLCGRKVNVTATTKIETNGAPVAVGSKVEVKGALAADGSINATKIEVGHNDDADDEFEFKGKIESLPSTPDLVGDWKVSGRTVHVTAKTEIDRDYGMVMVGAFVEVEGMLQSDGSVK